MATTARLKTVPRSEHIPKLIRFPPPIGKRLEKLASDERRTFQAQLLLIVERYFDELDQTKARK